MVKKKFYFIFSGLIFLAACQTADEGESADEIDALLENSWTDIENEAASTEVNLYMWGGDEGINEYIDEWVSPALEEEAAVTLNRIPMDTEEILQRLLTEKRAGRDAGSIDIIWLNGENFKNAKDNDLLAGSFTEELPNFQNYYDTESSAFQLDFGTAVDGMEAPWGQVQFVFHYDETQIDHPPENFQDLKGWIQENPGRFTYPNPSDFTGNAFIRHLLYENADEPSSVYNQPLDEEQMQDPAGQTLDYLEEIQPDLWREGSHYPNSLTELDRLYSNGEVWMTMGYNEARAESLVERGVFPESTRSFVMEPGSIGNTHFLSIPFNSPNMAGALVAINHMLSPEAQLEKMKPSPWGENTPISIDKLDDDMQQKFQEVDRGDTVLPTEKLEESFLPESDASYVGWLEDQWFNEIIQE
ncbi:ABC transporter substrate-binding protein [Alkalicoccus saliphilus]|uniref:ABC transporter substrate-binding protein n=1 Tax=Alkalicoccus saliphilus TaxID=200989 RepID=A0A2T4U599_9BACI|nr:ABC transporter substrate-binding protein [Alkalicoccus saliphilus]PTL38559.1 ABC transporter substrate-binding protein [Alkalicoccus saliphilus]